MLLKIAGMSSSSYFDARKRAYGAHFDSDYSIVEDIKAIRAGDNESESLGVSSLDNTDQCTKTRSQRDASKPQESSKGHASKRIT